jgi:hypothetical protein
LIADIENVYLRRAAVIAAIIPGAVFLYSAMVAASLVEAVKAFGDEWADNDAPAFWEALRDCWAAR